MNTSSVDFAIKNKIILCTGPAFQQFGLLKMITQNDMKHIPFKKIFLSASDPQTLTAIFNGKKPVTEQMTLRSKHVDCMNCIISTIRNAVNDPESQDDDIILFKHETVFINDMYLVRKAVEKLVQGHDTVTRRWIGRPHRLPYSPIHLTATFFIKVGSARPFFQEMEPWTDLREAPELFLTTSIVDKMANPYFIDFSHIWHHDNELGFHHLQKFENPKFMLWDKANYHTLYS